MKFSEYDWPIMYPDAKPFKHQVETTKFALMNKRAFILNDLGVGKSLSVLWACDFLFKNAKIKKVLIASPLSTLESVWGKEIFMHFPKLSYAIAHGTKQKRLEAIRSRVNFVIINHHGLSVMKQEIIKEKFDAFVIDELAVFKNHKTEFFKSAREIADKCNIVWGLTAEPTPEAPTEAYSQAKIVNPSNPLIPQTFYAFKNRVMMQISTFTWLPRPEAEKIVYGVLQPAIRFKRSECVDIPDCQIIDQEIELTPEQKTVYKQMKDELLVEYNDGLITASNAAVKMLKLIQVACGWVKSDDGNVMKLNSEPRLNALLDIFNNTEKGKLIVFTSFRAAVVGIKEFFESKNISSECIYSQISQGARAKNINDFQNGKLQTLIIQPQSAAHGITLTSANTAVWHTIIPSRTYYGQANGRITRIGQKSKQLIVRFHGCKEEKRILKLLEGKESMSESLLKMFED